MTTHDALLPAVVLQRKAVVYVRQSTPQQVQLNLESQRRQYELVEVACGRGFTNKDSDEYTPTHPGGVICCPLTECRSNRVEGLSKRATEL